MKNITAVLFLSAIAAHAVETNFTVEVVTPVVTTVTQVVEQAVTPVQVAEVRLERVTISPAATSNAFAVVAYSWRDAQGNSLYRDTIRLSAEQVDQLSGGAVGPLLGQINGMVGAWLDNVFTNRVIVQ